jgi:hypothetical protein
LYAEQLTGDPLSPAPPRKAPPSTGDRRIAKLFGLEGESWMRHANPASVWTRFTVLSILSLAIWSRDWIGAWCVIGVGLAIIWMFVNPLLFKAPKSTRNWASRTVLGERISVDRNRVDVPEQFRSPAASLIANAYSTIGMGILAFGLVDLNLLATVTGILITHGGKAWYLDRISLLFAEMKGRNDEYAAWDF